MAWAFVTAAATSTKTVTKSVTAGNLLVCGFACGDGTTTPTISDGVNSWTAVGASPVKDTTNAASVSLWWAVAATTASITITITATPTTFNGTWVGEWSGNAASSLDAGSTGLANIAGSTGADAMKTGAFTPSVDGCLVVSFINDDGLTDTVTQYTAGSNPVVFTKRTTASIDPGGGSQTTYGVEDAVQATAASINPTWTEAASHAAVGIAAAFKAPAAASGVGSSSSVFRAGRGPGAGPSLRRMMPQQLPAPALVDTVTPLPQIQALRSRGPGMGPRLRRMVPQRLQDAGATTTTLLPTEGAITIAGVAASITLTIAAVAGAITIAGNAPSVTTVLQGVQGSVVIAGNAASTTSILVPTVGAIVISGNASALTQTLVGVTGAMTIGGNAPSTTSILAATEGTIVIGGSAPSIIVSSGLTPTEGAITIAGNAPNLLAALSVLEGAISIGGNVPSLIIPTSASETFSGGYGEFARRFRTRAEEELRTEREQWGILPKAAQIVSAIAIRQADALDLDAEQRLEELERELELAGVQYQAQYLELLNLQRQRLIDAEIRGYFEAEEALGEENARRLMLLLAFLS